MGRYVAATDREDSWGRRCTQELTALLMDRGVFHMSCEEVQGLTIRALEHQSTQYATWKAAWQTFTALPQVFIAV